MYFTDVYTVAYVQHLRFKWMTKQGSGDHILEKYVRRISLIGLDVWYSSRHELTRVGPRSQSDGGGLHQEPAERHQGAGSGGFQEPGTEHPLDLPGSECGLGESEEGGGQAQYLHDQDRACGVG